MSLKFTVYTLASDDDNGTQAQVFTSERATVIALLDHLEVRGEAREQLIKAYFNPHDSGPDFYDMLQEHKSDLDTYNIDEHEVEFPNLST